MRLPGSSDSRWALAWLLGLLIVLLLLAAGPRAHGQTGSETAPPTLSASYLEAEQTLTLLLSRLAERRLQVLALQANLTQADEKLTSLLSDFQQLQTLLRETQESLNKQQTDLTETSTSLAALSTRYTDLEARWQAYRDEMTTQVDTLERSYARAKRWAIGFGVSTAVGFVVSLLLCLRLP